VQALTTLTSAGAAFFGGSRHNRQQPTRLVNALAKPSTVADNPHGSALALLRQQGEQWQETLVATLAELEEEYHRLIKTRLDPLFQGKRHALLKEIQADEDAALDLNPYERQINRQLAIAGVITGAAIVTAPLSALVQFVACVPLALYLIRNVYRQAYRALKQEQRLTMSVLLAVNQTLLWFGGFYILGGLIFILSNLGQKLGFISEVRSREQLVNIFGKLPQRVWILHEGIEIEIPFDQLQNGHVLVIGAGQMIPVDGEIIAGYASIDQHRLTGESQPAEKAVGDTVLAATLVLAGQIQVRVQKTGQATVAAQIGEMLRKTTSYQMAITAKAYQMADRSVTPTLAAAGLAWLLVGLPGAIAITSTMFGLNLILSGPLALRNYLLVATRRNILIKDGRSLDLLTEIDTVVFDKTGTLTLDQPHVTQVHPFAALDASTVLGYAAAVEQRQSHPIARAILAAAHERDLLLPAIDDTRYEMGYGLRAESAGQVIRVGSDRFMTLEQIPLPPAVQALQESCHALGHSLVMVALDKQLVGAIELEPTIRPEAKAVIAALRQRKLDFYIISGDQDGPTRSLAQALGIDNYFANTLPENKAQLVEQLQGAGRAICFVGDGINDSIALKKANVSVSLRGATSVAMDTAQVVLMDATLTQLPLLFQLADEMKQNLKTTQTLAIVPNLGIWAGVFFLHLGILGAAAIFEVSLWAGIANAMRPLFTYQEKAKE
jgi:heavy metal translocating P-type ATPase